MSYEKKDNHVSEALANFASPFIDQEQLRALLRGYIEQIQDLEDAASDTLTKTTVTSSTGAQLDQLGALVGEPRSGRDDVKYGTAVRARLVLNVDHGTIQDLIDLCAAIVDDPLITIEVTEEFPAGIVVRFLDPIDPLVVDTTQLAKFVAAGRPAGVKGQVIYGVTGSFRFDTGPGFDVGKWAVAESA